MDLPLLKNDSTDGGCCLLAIVEHGTRLLVHTAARVLAYMGSVSGEAYITKSIETRLGSQYIETWKYTTGDRKRVPVFGSNSTSSQPSF